MEKSREIIDKIKEKNIKPIPKWVFLSKRILLWLVFAMALLIGAVAFSIILFAIQQADFELLLHLSHSKIEFIIGLIPFIWIITLIIFLLIAFFSLQKSKKGYKRTISKILGINVALSILLGTLFFLTGGAKWLENTFENKIEIYESIQERKVKNWMQPENGQLAGTIKSVSENSLQLLDFNQKTWTVDIWDVFISPIVLLEEGEKIKLVGEQSDKHHFSAKEIRPWEGRGMKNKQGTGRNQ